MNSIAHPLIQSLLLMLASVHLVGSASAASTPRLKARPYLKTTSVFYVTHASRFFDTNGAAARGLRRRLRQARSQNIPIVYLVNGFNDDNQRKVYADTPATYRYLSYGGEHNIRIAGHTFLLAGGFLELCLGETLRDALTSVPSDYKGLIRVNLFADAIYVDTNPKVVAGLDDLTDTLQKENIVTLASIFKDASKSEWMNFLAAGLLHANQVGKQNGTHLINNEWVDAPKPAATFQDFRFRILRDGREVDFFGWGPRQVDLNFVIESASHP